MTKDAIYSARWRREYPERAKAVGAAWRLRNLRKTKAAQRRRAKRTLARTKEKLFALLGDKCVRCGFNDKRALQVDHVNGYRGQRNSPIRGGLPLYRLIVQGKVPKEDFQILCSNCNWIKKAENREVPGYHRRQSCQEQR